MSQERHGSQKDVINIPDDIMQQIIEYCRINEIAIATVGNPEVGVSMILFGERSLSPDEASIIAAHMLLTGVLTREFDERNRKLVEKEKIPIPKENLN